MSRNDPATFADTYAHGRAIALEEVRAVLSTPGMSAADVYASLAGWLDGEGFAPYEYDDPDNPYRPENPSGGVVEPEPIAAYQVVELTDGRRGYFYTSRMAGTPLFQPVDGAGLDSGTPELVDDDHEVAR